MFPVPGSWTVALDIGIQSDPAPTHVPDPSLSVPFHTNRDNRIYVVTILLTDGQRIRTFVIFVPASTLTTHLSLLKEPKNIPWEDWGPMGTRMIPTPGHSNVWVCYVYGMRFVAPLEIGGSGSTSIRVYDFNPLPIKRMAGQDRELDRDATYITEASDLDTQDVFEDIVTTSLPYRMSKVSLERSTIDGGRFGAVMCSEDNLIIVGVRYFCLHYFCHWYCAAENNNC